MVYHMRKGKLKWICIEIHLPNWFSSFAKYSNLFAQFYSVKEAIKCVSLIIFMRMNRIQNSWLSRTLNRYWMKFCLFVANPNNIKILLNKRWRYGWLYSVFYFLYISLVLSQPKNIKDFINVKCNLLWSTTVVHHMWKEVLKCIRI